MIESCAKRKQSKSDFKRSLPVCVRFLLNDTHAHRGEEQVGAGEKGEERETISLSILEN